MLLPLAGKPLILHTLEKARSARLVDRVIVATDDERIREVVSSSGGEVVMTAPSHQSGSDRIAEVAKDLPDGSVIVNVQGDEPLISPETIDAAVEALVSDAEADMSTTCEPLIDLRDELLNFNVVKVVKRDNGRALYFTRSPVPFPREASERWGGDPNAALFNEPELFENYRKHTGLYVYRREFLLKFASWPQTWLEKWEKLEQLRALEHDAKIRVVDAAGSSIGVDTQEDYERARDLIELGIDIRRAKRRDLPLVAAVHVESWQRSFAGIAPDDYLQSMSVEERLKAFSERECDEPYTMLVAEHPTEGIVGFADFGKSKLKGDFDAQIYSIYFLPEYQRRGLGSRLFERSVSRMLRDNVKTLCIDSLEVSPYRSFYEKIGGRVVGKDSHKLGNEEFATVIYGWDDITHI
jgi:3-deoxy-manno-octulosonate cytidylyltransferase (CMP-KDO synthetase)